MDIETEVIRTAKDSILYKGIQIKQLDKKQDHSEIGDYINKDGNRVDWIAVMDGHGNDTCINTIRNTDLSYIMYQDDPATALHDFIDADTTISKYDKFDSGSTFVAAKLIETEKNIQVEIFNVGDSTALIILNGDHIFTSEPHTAKHADQMMRLVAKGIVSPEEPLCIHDTYGFEVINSTTVISKKAEYIKLNTKQFGNKILYLAPSNSIGHNGIYGKLDVDVTKFVFKKTDIIKIVLMSDGITDVIKLTENIFIHAETPQQIVDEAVYRWKQTWNHIVDNNFTEIYKCAFENGYDDCSAAILQRKPI